MKDKAGWYAGILIISLFVVFLCAWIDSLIFGYNWRVYLIGCFLEVGCFLVGIVVGRLTHID